MAKRKVKYCAVQFAALKNSIRSIRETWPKKRGRFVSRRTEGCGLRADKRRKRVAQLDLAPKQVMFRFKMKI